MKLTKMISAALAAVMLCGSLSALPASARDVEVDPCGLWNTPGQGFAPQSREVFYTTTPESYDILDRGFGRISVKVRRTAISVTMNEPLTESITLGDFTLRPEYAKGKSDQYICTVEPQAEYLGRKARGSRLYVSDDADLTHCWQTRLEKTAETVPEENSYIIWQMSASAAQDDTEAYMQLFEALEADPRFTVKGAVYVCTQWYAPYTDWLYVQYADDSAEADVEAELTALGCDTSGKGRNPDENPAEDYWEYPCPAAAAKAIIEQYAADPRIGTIEPKSCVDGVEGSETFDVTALLLPCTTAFGDAVTADDIERQIMTYRAPEKNVEAQTYTSFLCPCLAFRWKGEGTPAGAVIGEHSLTENSEKLPDEYHDAPYQIQSVKTMAALLPSKIEAYDESTFDVPEELLQSDIWLITGAGSQESAKSILNDERIEACGIMYVSQLKYTDYDAFENPVTGETEYHPQDISLDNLHVSLDLVPLRHYAYGDSDGDGEVNLTDANAALLYYNLAAVAMADEAYYNLTPYEAKAADVNQDGIVDTKDANAIMLYYNCTVVSQVDDITWYGILKIPGVPGAPA